MGSCGCGCAGAVGLVGLGFANSMGPRLERPLTRFGEGGRGGRLEGGAAFAPSLCSSVSSGGCLWFSSGPCSSAFPGDCLWPSPGSCSSGCTGILSSAPPFFTAPFLPLVSSLRTSSSSSLLLFIPLASPTSTPAFPPTSTPTLSTSMSSGKNASSTLPPTASSPSISPTACPLSPSPGTPLPTPTPTSPTILYYMLQLYLMIFL